MTKEEKLREKRQFQRMKNEVISKSFGGEIRIDTSDLIHTLDRLVMYIGSFIDVEGKLDKAQEKHIKTLEEYNAKMEEINEFLSR